MMRSPISWLFIAAVLGVAGPAVGEVSPGEAVFNYVHGFSASGNFQGTCGLAGVIFPSGGPAELVLQAQRARLTVYETWLNETTVIKPVPTTLRTPEQHSTNYTLEGPDIRIRWDEGAHVALSRGALGHWSDNLRADLAGQEWSSGPVRGIFPTGPHRYHEMWHPDEVIWLDQVLFGPGAITRTNGSATSLHGEGFFKMDGATIEAGSVSIKLPPLHDEVWREETPLTVRRTVVETYAVLNVSGFQAVVDSGTSDIVCMELDWSGTGVVTYRTAAGRASRGNETANFDRKELTINGTFQAREEAFVVGPVLDSPAYITGQSQGDFRMVGLDFVEVLSVPNSSIPVKELSVAALILAGLVWLGFKLPQFLGFLHSRVVSDQALAHPLRQFLYDCSQQTPGLTLRAISRNAGQALRTVRHHVYIMENLGLIRTLRDGKALRVYAANAALPAERKRLVLERSEPVQYLVGILRERGTLGIRDAQQAIRQRFGCSRVGAWKAVRRAEQVKLVSRQSTPQGVLLCAPL